MEPELLITENTLLFLKTVSSSQKEFAQSVSDHASSCGNFRCENPLQYWTSVVFMKTTLDQFYSFRVLEYSFALDSEYGPDIATRLAVLFCEKTNSKKQEQIDSLWTMFPESAFRLIFSTAKYLADSHSTNPEMF